jgi:flagellar hook-basal body complex protein FliE
MPVAPIPPTVPQVAFGQAASGGGGAAAPHGFAQALQAAVASLDALQAQADAAAQELGSGQVADLATAVIAAEKANLALELAVEVRDRALGAYQQLMQLQM